MLSVCNPYLLHIIIFIYVDNDFHASLPNGENFAASPARVRMIPAMRMTVIMDCPCARSAPPNHDPMGIEAYETMRVMI
jgi:hypothetical protein